MAFLCIVGEKWSCRPCWSLHTHTHTYYVILYMFSDLRMVVYAKIQKKHSILYAFCHSACKGDDGALTYNEAADTCDAARRLSARRRSGGSWSSSRRSSSWSSPRRRAPFAPSTSPRRRSWMAPSATTARRRAPPPPPTRRRAPPPPVPSPLESRRRITSLSGNTYVTTPRRRYMGSDLAAVTWLFPVMRLYRQFQISL